MTISMIAAMARNRTIGVDNDLPWRIPDDMAYFKRMTTGTTVVMGRKTLESFGGPLKNRRNIVLTRSDDFSREGCEVVHTVEEVLEKYGEQDLMIIGGEQIYRLFLPHADRLLLTEIEEDFEGDTRFPEFDSNEWEQALREKGIRDEKNPYDYYYTTYVRRPAASL
ncbi:dihydrofolate reductase [Paenibacillus daejeonensis]|uniref:dihydrofolate reductase n=1 Tax=Paenibacillus daejeonensis TaxID=135193 RepID=UPI00035F4F01|nr:dihydrofolate reductase [Paenibacillus daejeonensis]